MKCKSDAIHNLILRIEAVSSPIDESGVWVRSDETGEDFVMFNGPLVGILSFPGDPGHVNVFMRTMEGDVLYIDPQNTTKANRVTRNRIVFKGVDSSAVAIGLCGPDTSLVRDVTTVSRCSTCVKHVHCPLWHQTLVVNELKRATPWILLDLNNCLCNVLTQLPCPFRG